jgi:hypothetical protein
MHYYERNSVVHAHPRSDHFKEVIIHTFYDDIRRKPDTTSLPRPLQLIPRPDQRDRTNYGATR